MQGAGGFEALLQGPTLLAGPRRLKGLPLRKRALPDQQQKTAEQGADRQQSLPEEAANSQPGRSAISSPDEEPAATEPAVPRSKPSQPEAGGRTGTPATVSPALQAYGSQHLLDQDSAIGSVPDEGNGNPSLQPHVADQQSAARPLETSAQQPPLATDELHHREVDSQVEQPVEGLDGQQDSAGNFISARQFSRCCTRCQHIPCQAPCESCSAAVRLLAGRDGPPTAGSPTVLVEPSPKSARAFWARRETGGTALNLPRPRTPVRSAAAEQQQANGAAVPQPAMHASDPPDPGASPSRVARPHAWCDSRPSITLRVLHPAVEPAARSKAAAAAEAAICDRFGNPVLSTGVANGPGRALAAAEDFRDGVPAFAFFREAATKAQEEARRAGGRSATGTSQAAPQASDEAQASEHLSQTSQNVSCSQPTGARRALCRLCRHRLQQHW